ncbi:50S ribosomal protein L32 [Candidatus Kaiserbacteria bacterium]|nr:50S ribosomal protein L32 [Candidatus Kaiserbacteria bacterium]
MVIRMRRNRSQTAQRRSNHGIYGQRLAKCECGAQRLSHRACAECGKYNGRIVIDVVGRTKRAVRRAKKKQTELRESGQATGTKEKETTPSSA